jgi:hypothetical protein
MYTFTPVFYSGCIQWLDGSDIATLYRDTAGTLPVNSNGQVVNLWKDKSTAGNNMISNVTSPTYSQTLSGLNGAISFAGSAGLSNSTGYALSSNASLFIVCAPNGWGTWGTLWSHSRINQWDSDIEFRQESITGGGYVSWHTNNDNNNYIAIPSSNTPVIYSCTMSNGINMYLQNFHSGSTASASYTESTATIASGTVAPLWLGRNSGGYAYNGYISEIVYYNTTLTTIQRQKVEGYLAWKWGLQASLPSGHPYLSAAPTG